MKKLLSLLVVTVIIFTSGCDKASNLLKPEENDNKEIFTQTPEPNNNNTDTPSENEPQTKIPLSQTLEMTNDWTLLGDYNFEITQKGVKDRIILGTSAEAKNGEMMWDDSQYWTLAVLVDHDQDGKTDGAYNLFSERVQGYVYAEVNEAFVKGVITPVITAYIFSGNDREIRNYIFDGEFFEESQEYTTGSFSTGGINNMYSTIPEYKPL